MFRQAITRLEPLPWHDPSWEERRRQWSIRGGHGKSNAVRAKKRLPAGVLTLEELRGVVGLTIADVRAGRVEPGVGTSVAALTRAYVAVTEASVADDLSRRLDELEVLAARSRLA